MSNRDRVLAVVFIAWLQTACIFDPSGGTSLLPLPEGPFAEPTSSEVNLVLEDPGTLAVFHGSACAESNQDGEEEVVRIQQELQIPSYANAAAVFLAGWQLQYLSSDHSVHGLATAIAGIELSGTTLRWEAGGAISDNNFDNGYSWCYRFTVVAWNQGNLDATVNQGDENVFIDTTNEHTTAVKVLRSSLQDTQFEGSPAVAILPRGFGLRWDRGDHHHLLHTSYNLDYVEKFGKNGKQYLGGGPTFPSDADQAGAGIVTWDTKTIFKDNSLRRDYDAGEMVSALAGSDVGLIQPPFTVLPREDSGLFTACAVGAGGVSTEEIAVEDIPFEYAVPLVTGWELAYACDDQRVTEIGVWLDTFSYEKPPGENGTLRYSLSSVLRDRDNEPRHASQHRVHILGLKPTPISPPTVEVLRPVANQSFPPAAMTTFNANAVDSEDGPLPASSLSWFSDRDGLLGSGNPLNASLSGPATPCSPDFVTHVITVRAVDSDGNVTTSQVEVQVGETC